MAEEVRILAPSPTPSQLPRARKHVLSDVGGRSNEGGLGGIVRLRWDSMGEKRKRMKEDKLT